jgi:hypothetical protein
VACLCVAEIWKYLSLSLSEFLLSKVDPAARWQALRKSDREMPLACGGWFSFASLSECWLSFMTGQEALLALAAYSIEGMVLRQGRLPDHAITLRHVWMNCLDSSALPPWFRYARLHPLRLTNKLNQGH